MNLVLLVRSLGMGGAERQLVLLARELSRRHDVTVLTFYSGADHFDESSIGQARLVRLDKRGRWDLLGFLWRYLSAVRRARPDVVYAFMGPASLVALTSRLGHSRARVVWGLRSSNVDLTHYGWFARRVRQLEARLSRRADRIVSNSVAGMLQAKADGFAGDRMIVIGNGIDTQSFRRHPDARDGLRRTLGLPAQSRLVGMLARIDPMKGHGIFLEAAAALARRQPDLHFVLGGDGPTTLVAALREQAEHLGLGTRLHWLGRVEDVTRVYSALDVAVSASIFGEGFSNAVGEAMACGLPCVVTDVGDSARIVADTGVVVPPGDARALAAGIQRLLALSDEERSAWGRRAAEHIGAHHSVHTMVAATEAALLELAA